MNKPIRYFITPVGMAAALANPDLLDTIQGVLQGNAHPMTIRSLHKRGMIEIERRLPLSALKEVRGVLLQNPPATASETSTSNGGTQGPVSYTFSETPKLPKFSPTVERVLTVAKGMEGTITFEALHAHPELHRMNPGTLRWAIQVLRRAGLAVSSRSDEPLESAAS